MGKQGKRVSFRDAPATHLTKGIAADFFAAATTPWGDAGLIRDVSRLRKSPPS
jgi:hypothetical protein